MPSSAAASEVRASAAAKSAPDGTGSVVLYRAPGYLARRFQQICAAIITESLAEEGLTQLQWAVICCVDDMPGIDQRRLAQALGIVPVNAGQIVDQLQEMAIVERRMNGVDRRTRQLHLTARGVKLRRRLHPSNRAVNARILEPLSPRERELLVDLLVRVIDGNAAHARPGAGRRKRGSQKKSLGKSRPLPSI
jgi:DNA-binding MarR family transcriptional regulator